MKPIIKFFLFCTLNFVCFISCKNESLQSDKLTDHQLNLLIEEGKISNIRLPEKAIIEKNGDISYKVTLPNNFKFMFETEQGFAFDPIAAITCTCSEGSGCSPVRAMGKVACVMQPSCRTCQLTGGRYGSSMGGKLLGIVHSDGYFGFITKRKLDKNDFFDGFLEIEEKDVLGQAQEWLFEWEESKNALMDMYSLIYDGKIPDFILQNTEIPSDHVYVKASMMGNTFAMPLPKEMVLDGMQVLDPIAGENICKCLSGQSGCIKKSKLGAIICLAGACVSCQMN